MEEAEAGGGSNQRDLPRNFERILKVLVVEDDCPNYTLACRMLKRHGLSVDRARNGLEAIDAIKRGEYDLVFMDLQMPAVGGLTRNLALRSFLDSNASPDPHVNHGKSNR